MNVFKQTQGIKKTRSFQMPLKLIKKRIINISKRWDFVVK